MNKVVIIDISSLMGTNNLTGIQRVTIELANRIINSNNNCILIYYSKLFSSFYYIDKNSFLENCYSPQRKQKIKILRKKFDFKKIAGKFVLLDIDSVWDWICCYPRFALYKKVKQYNGEIVSLIHDLLPISNPNFWPGYDTSFLLYIGAVLKFTDKVIVTTNAVKEEFKALSLRCGVEKKHIYVMPLGSNLKEDFDLNKVSKQVKIASKSKYLLIVATLEPRKNHKVLLDAFFNIATKYKSISLIIAGRLGWMYEKNIKQIKKSNLYNKRLYLFNNASNDDIIYLYKNAYAFVFPSLAEGYGLPLVEALYYRTPVFASNIPVFKEISKGLAVFFDPFNSCDLESKLSLYLKNNKMYRVLKDKTKEFLPLTWNDSFNILKKIIS